MAKNQLAQQQLLGSETATPHDRSEESLQLRTPKAKPVAKKPGSQIRANWLLLLIQKRPLLVWSVLLGAILLAGGIAAFGLANPDYGKKEELGEAVVSVDIPDAVSKEQSYEEPPAWLFGAIAAVCATGTWAILKQLKGSRLRRKIRKPLKKRPTSRQPVDRPRQKTAYSVDRPVVDPEMEKRSAADSDLQEDAPAIQISLQNSNESKLAESLDLRKRQPLSYLLRNRR